MRVRVSKDRNVKIPITEAPILGVRVSLVEDGVESGFVPNQKSVFLITEFNDQSKFLRMVKNFFASSQSLDAIDPGDLLCPEVMIPR